MIYSEHIWIDPAYRQRLQLCGLDSVQRILTRVDGNVAAWSRTTDTLRVPGPDGQPGFYLKRHFFPTWSKRLRGMLRGTFFGMHRSQAECRALNLIRSLGGPAVRPVAYGGRRVAHFLTACFLITEEVPEAENLTTVAQGLGGSRMELNRSKRRHLLEELADQLAALHLAGCCHGNLFWRNVLVRDGPDGQPEFFLVDPQPPHAWERLGAGGQWWLHELAQVAASALPFTSAMERLRFLVRYLKRTGCAASAATCCRQIDRLVRSWRRHEERRIRMNRLFTEWNRRLAEESQFRPLEASGSQTSEPGP